MFESVLFQVKQWNEGLKRGWKEGWRERRKRWAWSADLRLNLLSVAVEGTTLNYKLSTSVQAPPRHSSHKSQLPPLHTAPFQVRTAFPRAQDLPNKQGAPSCRQGTGMCLELLGQICPEIPKAPRAPRHHSAPSRLWIFHPAQWIVAFQN